MHRALRALLPSALLVTGSLLGVGTVTVVAQDESPAPDPAELLADSDFAGVFPAEVGGLPWDELTVSVGAENREDQEEEELAETEALLDALGATIDDLTTVTASRVNEDFTEFTFMIAFRVSGVDTDDLLEGILPSLIEDLAQPRQESGQVAGKDVLLLYEDASPDPQPFYVYAGGDTVWLVLSNAESVAIEALGMLP